MLHTFHFGIEFEYALLNKKGQFVDFTNTSFSELHKLLYQNIPGTDDTDLKKGDLGIKTGYWYIEGDERFDEQGNFTTMHIKGVEIRTPICDSIDSALDSLTVIQANLQSVLQPHYDLAIIGFNPFTAEYKETPPLNKWEQAMRNEHTEYEASFVSNLSYGPDINFSCKNWTDAQVVAIGEKLTYYSPFMVPFSFSSPFFNGKLWQGLSKRTYERTWRRPAARVFIPNSNSQLAMAPRLNAEHGRIEFKAFDAITSVDLLRALCFLVLGVALATDLPNKAQTPNKALHQLAAQQGFASDEIHSGALAVITAAEKALAQQLPQQKDPLALLKNMLNEGKTPADKQIEKFRRDGGGTVITKGLL